MNPVSRDDSYPQIVSNVYVEKINANESLPESNNDGGDDDDDDDDGDGDVCEAEAVKHLTDNLCEDKNGNLSEENNEFLMMVHCKNRKHLNKKLSKTCLPNKSKRDYHLHRSSDHNSNSDVRESPDDDGCCNNVCSKFYKRNSEDSLSNYEIAAWTVSLSTSQSKSGSPGTVDLESVSEDEITLESENSYHIIDLKNEIRDGQFNSSSFPVAVSVENDVSEITKPVDLSHFKNAFVDKHKKDSLLKTQKLTNLSSVRHTTLGDSVIQDSENDSAKGASCIIQNTPKKVSDKTKLKLKANEESILKNVTEKCDASGFSDSSNKSFILENSSIPDVNSQVYFEIPQNCELNESESTQKTKNDSCKTKKHLYQEEACCSNRNRYGYDLDNEPIHMTLEEVKTSLKQLYENKNFQEPAKSTHYSSTNPTEEKPSRAQIKKGFHICLRHKKSRDGNDCDHEKRVQHRKSFPTTLKQTFCSWFGKKNSSPKRARTRGHSKSHEELSYNDILSSNLLSTPSRSIPSLSPFVNRALPPVPSSSRNDDNQQLQEDQAFNNDQERSESPTMADATSIDFTSSIHKVKDCGWYWGPISGEMAERILASEPDGSFIVRDSSDEHYIFSLTFKLNGLVRHVRIEHNQGKFSFGNFTNFKSQTIVGFIENAVEHSRSGRYLFFLHRRPLLGPMRVQLLHPVSRFKQVQSLQHMCRFVVLKCVRRDLIYKLPLPKRLKDYLNTPQYYTENMDMMTDEDINTPVLPATTPEQNLLHGELTNPSYR